MVCFFKYPINLWFDHLYYNMFDPQNTFFADFTHILITAPDEKCLTKYYLLILKNMN